MTVHPKYYEIIEELKKIVEAKNADYTGDKIPLYNLRFIERFGIPAWKGVLARITDKWTRFETLIETKGKTKVTNETLEDTLKDLINYLIFFLIIYKERKE